MPVFDQKVSIKCAKLVDARKEKSELTVFGYRHSQDVVYKCHDLLFKLPYSGGIFFVSNSIAVSYLIGRRFSQSVTFSF